MGSEGGDLPQRQMSTLAINGGKPAVTGPLLPFKTIDWEEFRAIDSALASPLSGFLGGQERGGYRVNKLEDRWCEIFGVKHAVACNSATSGLLMACMAAQTSGRYVVTTPFTMSATAAAPRVIGSTIKFGDIEDQTFCLAPDAQLMGAYTRAVIVTNLFGHPAELTWWRKQCDRAGTLLIEDNAQGIFAKEGGRYAGTIGHMGVFSLNVHKHLQAGEGGVVVTDDDDLAARLRGARNHGEMSGSPVCGLNLRMTELEATIALVQLSKRHEIMEGRLRAALSMSDAVHVLPNLVGPKVREGCTHSYYILPLRVSHHREWFVAAMNAEGVPLRAGYVDPLYRLPAFDGFACYCPVSERMHDRELVIYENCAWSPTERQLEQFGEAFEKVVCSPRMMEAA